MTIADRVERGLGHVFSSQALLTQALTHRSFSATHNERFEFLGDAVLDCIASDLLCERFPELPEGVLSRLRANLVKQDTLADMATALDLGPLLRLGEGEVKTGGRSRPSILADALEALIGAVFIDAGYPAARQTVARLFGRRLTDLDPTADARDPKTALQEWLQARRTALPCPSVSVGKPAMRSAPSAISGRACFTRWQSSIASAREWRRFMRFRIMSSPCCRER